jgi:hypothetical protein
METRKRSDPGCFADYSATSSTGANRVLPLLALLPAGVMISGLRRYKDRWRVMLLLMLLGGFFWTLGLRGL